MAAKRRPGDESRVLLIEAAARIINEQGYAALTARNLAERVGLKRQIVHYYFQTMEDLLRAVVRHYGEEGLARFAEALETEMPLRVLWETPADSSATTFAFLAMASHLPAIRAEVLAYLEKFKVMQTEALARYVNAHGLTLQIEPIAAVIVIQSIAQSLSAEAALGTQQGHVETKAAVEAWLTSICVPAQEKHVWFRRQAGPRP